MSSLVWIQYTRIKITRRNKMKINEVNISAPRNIRGNQKKQFATNTVVKLACAFDNFQKSNSPSFGAKGYIFDGYTQDDFKLNAEWDWDEGTVSYNRFARSNLKFYERSDEELRQIAKELCLYHPVDIMYFSKVWKRKLLFFRIEDEKLSEQSYERILPFVEEERKKVREYIDTILNYSQFEVSDELDMVQSKEMITKLLFEPARANKYAKDGQIPVANGILIYGESVIKKDELYMWIKKQSNMRFAYSFYDPNNPQKSLDNLKRELSIAKEYDRYQNRRTLIDISNFDRLLTDYHSPQSRRMIAQFKNLAEVASKEYSTTLIMSTDKNIDEFESAAIGAQRFDLQVELNKKLINPVETAKYNQAKESLIKLRELGLEALYKYTETTRLDYSNVDKLDD